MTFCHYGFKETQYLPMNLDAKYYKDIYEEKLSEKAKQLYHLISKITYVVQVHDILFTIYIRKTIITEEFLKYQIFSFLFLDPHFHSLTYMFSLLS